MSKPTLRIPIQTPELKPCITTGDTIPKITITFGVAVVIDLTLLGVVIKMQIYKMIKGVSQVYILEEIEFFFTE